MQSSKIILVLMVIAVAVAGCQAVADHPVSGALPPSAGWITPGAVHSAVSGCCQRYCGCPGAGAHPVDRLVHRPE